LGPGPAMAQLGPTPVQQTASAALPDFLLADVRPGMTGFGLTAGPGDVIERFQVEVIGVHNAAGPGFDLVLVRVSGPFIEASGGVAAGMSGSPVYLFGGPQPSLLGAIGYVFPNADHSLALVTPIAAMRDEVAVTNVSQPPYVPGLGVAMPVTTPVLL